MDKHFSSPELLEGAPIGVVFYVDNQPVAVSATVQSDQPLRMVTCDGNAKLLESGRRAMLILQHEGKFSKAEAQITACVHEGDTWYIEAGNFGWEQVDRRRYPRFNIQVPVKIKAVLEREGQAELKYVEAITEDMSLGGAWVRAADGLQAGSLVEFQAELTPGEGIRVLAIVAWSANSQDGLGLEFVDFIGGSRYYLHNYLNKAA